MRFISTRSKETASGAEAILRGIAKDGGLYVPEEFPQMKDLIQDGLPYEKICHKILDQFFPELELKEQEIKQGYESFALENNGELKKVGDRYVLELFHGPTAAFKDFALQILPLLLQKSKRYLKDTNRTLILTATSGDTGKAALEGFANLEGMDTGIDVLVLYPSEGVSPIQKQQMITQEGKNVVVLGIEGDFDDAQTAVKQAFLNKKLQQDLLEHKIQLSSANSINIGRLVPQIAYYFFAYNELMRLGEIRQGEKISFSVPTGNFGDILAGFYAKKMGLPVDQLICASNENKILKEFFETGIYDRRRALIQTASPSMDIIISSNLERLLFHALEDSEAVGSYMKQLDQEGIYTLSEKQREKLIGLGIQGGYLKMPASYEAIGEVYSDYGYLMDPHTAIAWGVASEKNIASKMVVLSTANPYKFPGSVCDALHLKYENHMDSMDKLQEYTKVPLPMSILFVLGKKPLHQKVIQHQALEEEIRAWLHGGKFSLKVPATTANIGPGFDALGIALNLYAEFEFDYEGIDMNNKIQDIDLKLVGVQEEYGGKENLIYRSLVQALTKIETKRIPKALKIYASSDIPISRGLGSSAACIVAGVTAAFEISKLPYSREQVLEIANEIEGHPDNVAPAIYGGFRASTQRAGKVYSQSLAIHNDLKFIAAVPSFMLSTEKARGILPKEVPFQDAVFNVSNVALLLGCFQNRDYQGLAVALEDSLHQNYRLPLIQGGAEVLKKAATSRGAYVSGAGPTIMILDENSEKYQDLLSDEIWNVFELQVDFSGTKVEGII